MCNCKTLYPIMLVHGMGFRDGKICYWGRIPEVLRKNGSEIYFGCQDANGSIEENAVTLSENLEKILEKSGAEKVNIIAHSKGGLEARYMISSLGKADKIASLTTISTPHNGSVTMDKIMKIPNFLLKTGSAVTDFIKRISGDEKPDTYRCLEELCTSYARDFNEKNPDSPKVVYRSCAFVMKSVFSDIFMGFPYLTVKILDGKSDGFLTPEEVTHGEFLGVFTGSGRRGISHCDEVDMRRKNFSRKIPSDIHEISDITEFYKKLVSGLREIGL